MNWQRLLCLLTLFAGSWRSLHGEEIKEVELIPAVRLYVETRTAEFAEIPEERCVILDQFAREISELLNSGQPAPLTFICTHNSRRSHLGQVWAAVASEYYHIDGVQTYSGGTEATACNPRTVDAFKRAGLRVSSSGAEENPRYEIRYATDGAPLVCFSKVYNDQFNPQQGFIAIMTCSDADQKCPVVTGAKVRIAVTYADPKQADGTPEEAARYDERSRQIAREMLYAFSKVARK